MGKIVQMLRKDVLPHARITAEGKAEITYDHGKTWQPAPGGEIKLNPYPMVPWTAQD